MTANDCLLVLIAWIVVWVYDVLRFERLLRELVVDALLVTCFVVQVCFGLFV